MNTQREYEVVKNVGSANYVKLGEMAPGDIIYGTLIQVQVVTPKDKITGKEDPSRTFQSFIFKLTEDFKYSEKGAAKNTLRASEEISISAAPLARNYEAGEIVEGKTYIMHYKGMKRNVKTGRDFHDLTIQEAVMKGNKNLMVEGEQELELE